MVEHLTAQEQHARWIRASVAVKRRLAEQLVKKHTRPIAIIARKQLPHVGEFSALELPRQRRQLSTLAAAAYGMARAAKVHEATFLEAGLPADVVEQLVAGTDALEEAITDKGRAEGARVKATEGGPRTTRISLMLRDGFEHVVERSPCPRGTEGLFQQVVDLPETPIGQRCLPEAEGERALPHRAEAPGEKSGYSLVVVDIEDQLEGPSALRGDGSEKTSNEQRADVIGSA